MAYETILTEREDSTFIITLNRPDKLNALSPKLREEVVDALRQVHDDPGVRAIIITGGPKVFAAGADLQSMSTAGTVDIFAGSLMTDMFNMVAEMPQPTIAAVAGYALGGGCELSMCCDFRIAADTAKFGQPEIKVGLIPGAGGTQRLTRLVGLTKAKELVFLGENIDANEAHRIGLVNKIVPADELMNEAKKMASKLAALPPFNLRVAKAIMDKGQDVGLEAALQMERLAFTALFGTEDQKEGVMAFVQKRKPEFKGR